VVTPRGLAEALRTIDALSAELAGAHAQLRLLSETIADRDRRLASANRDVDGHQGNARLPRRARWAQALAGIEIVPRAPTAGRSMTGNRITGRGTRLHRGTGGEQ
jgi:hypothetical protein